jgi:hypothetical protein
MVEKWNIDYSELKMDDGLILFSSPYHPDKNRSHSAKRGSSVSHHSSIPSFHPAASGIYGTANLL